MTQIDANKVELDLARKLFWLMKHERIFFSGYNEEKRTWDSGVYPCVSCNDIMVAGADAESLEEGEIDLFIDVCKKYPKYAEYAWCLGKRNGNPWRHPNTQEEQEAVDYVVRLLNEHI